MANVPTVKNLQHYSCMLLKKFGYIPCNYQHFTIIFLTLCRKILFIYLPIVSVCQSFVIMTKSKKNLVIFLLIIIGLYLNNFK